MPLVVPGINSGDSGASEQQIWASLLRGKTLTESTSNETSVAKSDLPDPHRVLEPGAMKTMDFRPDRLNVHLGEDGKVTDVTFG